MTEDSLCNLARLFSSKPQIADALCVKLDGAEHATTPGARAGHLRAFVNQVEAQTGKALTDADAAILKALAAAL